MKDKLGFYYKTNGNVLPKDYFDEFGVRYITFDASLKLSKYIKCYGYLPEFVMFQQLDFKTKEELDKYPNDIMIFNYDIFIKNVKCLVEWEELEKLKTYYHYNKMMEEL